MFLVFFFNDTATTEIYTLSPHDALPILVKIEEALKHSKRFKPSKARQTQIVEWHKHFTKRTMPRSNRTGLSDGTIDLEGVYYDILNILTDDASITCDAGDFGGWLIRYYKWNKPHTFFGPTTGAMGYAMPAAIAAKLARPQAPAIARSEEHTSELQSQAYLVCRLLLEKKKTTPPTHSVDRRRVYMNS